MSKDVKVKHKKMLKRLKKIRYNRNYMFFIMEVIALMMSSLILSCIYMIGIVKKEHFMPLN